MILELRIKNWKRTTTPTSALDISRFILECAPVYLYFMNAAFFGFVPAPFFWPYASPWLSFLLLHFIRSPAPSPYPAAPPLPMHLHQLASSLLELPRIAACDSTASFSTFESKKVMIAMGAIKTQGKFTSPTLRTRACSMTFQKRSISTRVSHGDFLTF